MRRVSIEIQTQVCKKQSYLRMPYMSNFYVDGQKDKQTAKCWKINASNTNKEKMLISLRPRVCIGGQMGTKKHINLEN